MPITPNARARAVALSEERTATQKDAYRDKIENLQRCFSPPLSNGELSVALELDDRDTKLTSVARFVSDSSRLRRAVPDRITRALIDEMIDGRLILAVQEGPTPRDTLICEPNAFQRLGRKWRSHLAPLNDDDLDFSGGAVVPPAAKPRSIMPTTSDRSPATPSAPTDRRLLAERPAIPPIGLGCMRLSTDGRPDEADSIRLLHEAFALGVRLLDTADAYALHTRDMGHNEKLIREALNTYEGPRDEIIVATKLGMIRPSGKWRPDGKPANLRKRCIKSLKALGCEALDLVQLHVPDPSVPYYESVGELFRLREEGKIRHIGVCNVKPDDLIEAMQVGPIACVQNQINVKDKVSLTNGVARLCLQNNIPMIAHSVLGGAAKRKRIGEERTLNAIADTHGVTAFEVALAWWIGLTPQGFAIPGATRIESVRASMNALNLELTAEDWTALDRRFKFGPDVRSLVGTAPAEPEPIVTDAPVDDEGEIVILMGIPGAGKSSLVAPYVDRGYERLNRDELGGKLDDLLPKLEDHLRAGRRRVVLDNTYPRRRQRRPIVELAKRAGVPVVCKHLTTSIADAQVNAVARMFANHGKLLMPDEIKAHAKTEANLFGPGVQYAYEKRFETPSESEGFAVESLAFVRRPAPATYTNKALLLDYDGTLRTTKSGNNYPVEPDDVEVLPDRTDLLRRYQAAGFRLLGVSNQSGVATGKLTYDDAVACFERTNELLGIDIEYYFCPHNFRPLDCYCRKPMPGIALSVIEKYKLDRQHTIMVGDLASDETFAQRAGIRFVHADEFFASEQWKAPPN